MSPCEVFMVFYPPPKEVEDAGTLVAQIRLVRKNQGKDLDDAVIFLVAWGSIGQKIFTAVFDEGKCALGNARLLANTVCHQSGVVVNAFLKNWEMASCEVVELEIRDDTKAGKTFAKDFLDARPDLEGLVRF